MKLYPYENTSAICRYIGGTPAAVALCIFVALGTLPGEDQPPPSPPQAHDLSALTLEELGNVKITSASLHEQTLQDAPASVTVITAEEIRNFGYRTLAEALSWVRGFYATYDDTYAAIGMRGFSLPGYETRYLVLINGHSMSESILEATFVGNDLPLDMDLIDRIEVVRGPSSALYGSAAMLATINVITKRPSDAPGTSVRIETDSLGERKIEVSEGLALGHRANLLFSSSLFNNAGAQQLYFSGYDTPQNNFGRAMNVDGEKGYRFFADLTWGNWEAIALAGDRIKIQPYSWGDTLFNDRGTRVEDSRGYFELSYTRDFPGDRTLAWRASYDAYRYRGVYHYCYSAGCAVEDDREHDYGDWLSSRLTYRFSDGRAGHLTLGADASLDLRALQHVFAVAPEQQIFLRIDRPDRYFGLFAQQEWEFTPRWKVDAGLRFDWSWLKRDALSPRIALVYTPSSKTNLKLSYGHGFRNPSSYDMFYDDGFTQIGNPALRPETTDAYEIDFERSLTRKLRASASLYYYYVGDMIEQIYTDGVITQYVNADHVHASGASLELSWALPGNMRLSSSLELQRAVMGSGQPLPNSPGQVGKIRLLVPFWGNRFTLAVGAQALGQRQTYAGATVPWVILPDAVINMKSLPGGFQLTAGVHNLSNSFYRDPSGITPTVDSVIGAGRTFFFTATWHSPPEPAKSPSR